MTNQEFKTTLINYISNYASQTSIEVKVDKLLLSGCIDIGAIEKGNYTQVQAAAYCILQAIAAGCQPRTKEGKEEAKNIEKFI